MTDIFLWNWAKSSWETKCLVCTTTKTKNANTQTAMNFAKQVTDNNKLELTSNFWTWLENLLSKLKKTQGGLQTRENHSIFKPETN